MSMSDPIGDMLTRIRNACCAEKTEVSMPSSKQKAAVAEVLKESGFIGDYRVEGEIRKVLTIELKYHDGVSVIEGVQRISKPSRRIYAGAGDIPRVMGGLGIAILSTSQGILTDRAAREKNVGGEVICQVW
jgi:small subunit ribosomal protein S8